MKLTATDLLELQYKVCKLQGIFSVVKNLEGYFLKVTYFDREDGTETVTTFVTHENKSHNSKGTYNYETMLYVLNVAVEKEEKERLKEQKRQELLDRLTEEERELLGF